MPVEEPRAVHGFRGLVDVGALHNRRVHSVLPQEREKRPAPAFRLELAAQEGGDDLSFGRLSDDAHAGPKNSPSRCRFCPPNRRTFRFRVLPAGWASAYLRSALGASGTLTDRPRPIKRVRER